MAPREKAGYHHGMDDNSVDSYPNDTMRLLLRRSSCRSFYKKKIPRDVLHQILEAGVHAPTGGNLQPYSIIQIEDKQTKHTLAGLCGEQSFIDTAPTDLLFCIDYRRLERWAKLEIAPYAASSSFRCFWIAFQDTIIAAQNICTAADAMDLGSVYVGTVLECFPQLRNMFQLPDGVFPVVLLSLGYPKVRPAPKRKLGVPVVVHEERYHELSDEDLLAAYETKYPGARRELTQERMGILRRVCRETHGEKFADQCLEKVRAQGYINMVQHYFGLHYRASDMAEGNDTYLDLMGQFGFSWFKKFKPKR